MDNLHPAADAVNDTIDLKWPNGRPAGFVAADSDEGRAIAARRLAARPPALSLVPTADVQSAGRYTASGAYIPPTKAEQAAADAVWNARVQAAEAERVKATTIKMSYRVAASIPPPPAPSLIVFRHISDILAEKREAVWLLDDIIEAGVLAVLAGPRGSFKSFIAHDWGMRIAMLGHSVLILSGEGAGLDRRTDAWLKHFYKSVDVTKIPMLALERPLSLNMPQELEALRVAIAALPTKPAFIVIDTFSKFTPGLKENDNADVATFLSGLSKSLREEFGATVLIVAHSGHADEKRPRGAYVLMANPDCEYIVTRTGMNVSVTRDRFKDSPSLPPLGYLGTVIDLGRKDKRGQPVTSLAFASAAVVIPDKGGDKYGKNQTAGRTALAEFKRANPTCKAISVEDIRDMLAAQKIPSKRRAEVIEHLVISGLLVATMGGLAFP
jgi:hypothetical protein